MLSLTAKTKNNLHASLSTCSQTLLCMGVCMNLHATATLINIYLVDSMSSQLIRQFKIVL